MDGALSRVKISRFCREDNLILFGDALWALPDHISGSDLDGLKVLRPGLHLGTLVRGRFEPAHALAMALRREEVFRSISLPGTSPHAYAWFRGESIPTGETADICDRSKSQSRQNSQRHRGEPADICDGLRSAETGSPSAAVNETVNENEKDDNIDFSVSSETGPADAFHGRITQNLKEFKGWCLVTIDGCAAGWGKAGGNVIKNHYPKGLRKGSWYR